MSSKSKRIVSVFDRLGPGTDESSGSSSRKYSSDKVSDKSSRHGYPPLTSPEPHTTREKKTHSEFDDKKHIYHRDGRAKPHPLDQDSGGDEERFDKRKLQSKGHKVGTKRPRHGGSSSESPASESDTETNKRHKRDSEAIRSTKHSTDIEKRRHHERKDKIEHTNAVMEVKGRSHHVVPHDHKRRREDEYYNEKKRKHDDEISSYDHKKARVSEASPPHREVRPREVPEHKRRHDHSPREGYSRSRHTRSHTPTDTTPTSRKPELSPITCKSDKKSSHNKKPSLSIDGEALPTETPKALDWDYLSNYTLRQTAKLDQSKPRSVLERFTPGALFSRVGVSLLLAGSNYYNAISTVVSSHFMQQTNYPEDISQNPFDRCELGAVGLARIRQAHSWSNVFKTGDCRKALTASDDISIRRKLRKHNQSDFLPRIGGSSWESQHYPTGVALYQNLGKKSSGKPAFRIQGSQIGELLVAR